MIGKPNYNVRNSTPSGTGAAKVKPSITPMSRKQHSNLERIQSQNLKVNAANKKANEQQNQQESGQSDYLSKISSLLQKQHESFMKYSKLANSYKPYLKKFADASPQLKLQTKLLQQSFKLMVRPFGDMIANLIRPFVRMFLRLALHMYKYYSYMNKIMNLFSLSKNTYSVQDKAEQLLVQQRHAEVEGDQTNIDRIALLLEQLKKEDRGAVTAAQIKDKAQQIETRAPYIAQSIKDGAGDQLKEWMDSAKTWWDQNKEKFITPVSEAFTKVKDGVLDGLSAISDSAKLWWTFGKKLLKSDTEGGLDSITKAADDWFNKMKTRYSTPSGGGSGGSGYGGGGGGARTSDTSQNTVPSVGGTLSRSFLPGLSSLVSSIWGKSQATGGDINETGLYTLHAGEKVIPASKNSNKNYSKSINVVNNFTIHANIANNIDIRSLASKLSELHETELRRRSSY
jgi:hypothetical protein